MRVLLTVVLCSTIGGAQAPDPVVDNWRGTLTSAAASAGSRRDEGRPAGRRYFCRS